MKMLEIAGLTVRYGNRVAVDGVSLSIASGEIVALCGPSGSGKSTVAGAGIGLLPADAVIEGEIRIEGVGVSAFGERAWAAVRGHRIGFVWQDPLAALDPLMTIGGQVAEPLRAAGLGRRAAAAQAADVLARVGLDAARVSPARYPHQLSGGQRGRVGIAAAVAAGPRLVIADEPTAALDATSQAEVIERLRSLVRKDGIGLLLVTHDLALAAAEADRVIVMADGRIVEAGVTKGVLDTPSAVSTRTMVDAARRTSPRPSAARAPLLEIDRVSRRHPGGGGVDAVSLAVGRGEMVALIGASGAGKSTLARAVLALERIDAGEVRIDGHSITGARGRALRALRRRVQAVFQDPGASLDPRLSISASIAEPLGLLDQPLTRVDRDARVARALVSVGLSPDDAGRRPHQFSGGQRQRVALARALVIEPELLVLDEATSALDTVAKAAILDLVAGLAASRGLSVLLVTHDLAAARRIADRVAMMADGRIVEAGPTVDLLDRPQHPHTRALVKASPDFEQALQARYQAR